MRAHLYRPIQNNQGDIRVGSVVRVLQPGTGNPITDPLYVNDSGATTLPNPFTTSSGVVDLYLDAPQRIRLGIRAGNEAEYFINDLDVMPPADLRYMPLLPPDPLATDPETGQTGIEYARLTLQTVVAGPLAVSPSIIKPGLRVPVPGQAFAIFARVGTAPTGGPIVIAVKRNNSSGVYASDIGTVTIPADASTGTAIGLAADAAKGDVLVFEVISVGSTVAGADLNISVDFR